MEVVSIIDKLTSIEFDDELDHDGDYEIGFLIGRDYQGVIISREQVKEIYEHLGKILKN